MRTDRVVTKIIPRIVGAPKPVIVGKYNVGKLGKYLFYTLLSRTTLDHNYLPTCS